jgi:hypothetical protein
MMDTASLTTGMEVEFRQGAGRRLRWSRGTVIEVVDPVWVHVRRSDGVVGSVRAQKIRIPESGVDE